MDETIVYLLFRILQLCYKLFNSFLRLVFNRCFMFGPAGTGIRKLKIIGRAKSRGAGAVQEIACLDNFILYFDSYVDGFETELHKPEVSLYGFTPEFAYFSVVSPGQSVWDTGVFSSPEQFNKAQYLILVPVKELNRILASADSTKSKNIFFLHHTNRCGSTLVAAMFKRLPSTRVICEPESFYSAYYLYHINKTVTQEQYKEMVEAAVMIHCLTPHKTIFLKMVSGACTSQMNMLHNLFPHSKTAFLSRNSTDVVNSMMKIVNSGHPLVGRLLDWSRDDFIRSGLWATERHKYPRDCRGVLLHNWNICMATLEAAKMPVKALTYETLVAEPKQTVNDIMKFFDIPSEHADNMVAAMDRDSQEGTRIARHILKPKSS
eukprot:TRINITY_DN33526_c0_g1_i1.p1 TRINITY_DN33526_c0_g1~~TRINITY_DN33526_c0_g1_i1.p1  ORF type:complete len:394 (-),score=69.60 TRINITY_DN33526_c0_g1_i1:304-1434(-)